jgi:tRNA-Thr(GGU) m(6)t(6)A37 methyltransferase TsaA
MHNGDRQFGTAVITMIPIGVIRTPFKQSEGTPIQSAAADGAEGVVELFSEFTLGLRDVADFDRLWLVYLLDRAAEPQLIARPYLDTQDHGIFATRSPARPNHIGLSPVRLLGIEGNLLRVSGVDMLDGTPLLDIKPYVPEFDCFEVKRVGWYKGKSARNVAADDRFEARKTDHQL